MSRTTYPDHFDHLPSAEPMRQPHKGRHARPRFVARAERRQAVTR